MTLSFLIPFNLPSVMPMFLMVLSSRQFSLKTLTLTTRIHPAAGILVIGRKRTFYFTNVLRTASASRMFA